MFLANFLVHSMFLNVKDVVQSTVGGQVPIASENAHDKSHEHRTLGVITSSTVTISTWKERSGFIVNMFLPLSTSIVYCGLLLLLFQFVMIHSTEWIGT